MDFIITNISSESAGVSVLIAASNNAAGAHEAYIANWEAILGTIVPGDFWLFDNAQQALSQSETEFQEQKRMFNEIPPLLLEPYRGQFVASRNGLVVDTDDDFVNLTHRFFQNAGDVPVYVTKIGEDEGIFIETPFSD